MNNKLLSILFSILIVATILSGCISGGGDSDEVETTTAPPTTSAPTNAPTTSAPTTAAPTQPPTTVPPTPTLVHNECSTSYRGLGPGNTRYYGCSLSNNPNELWKAELSILSYIMVDYDRAYLIARNSSDYELQCLNVNTGELYWATKLPFLRCYDLILLDEKLYVFEKGDEKTLKCYDAHDGELLWTSDDIMAEYPEIGDISVGINHYNGKIIVTGGFSGENRTLISCLDSHDGEIIWNALVDYDNIHHYPAIENGIAYYSASLYEASDKIIGLDIDTGHMVYDFSKSSIDNFNGRRIAVSDGRIYAYAQGLDTYDSYIYCISTSNSSVIWRSEMTFGHITVGDDKVFITTDDHIYCLDKATGHQIWSKQMEYHTINLPFATNDKLIVFRSQYQTEVPPEIIYLDVNTGEEIWSMILEGTHLENGASFYEGKVLVGTENGYIYCFS